MAKKPTASFWVKLQSSLPVVAMLLIEQFYGYGQVIRSASRQIGLLITLWAFGAMLLGMCYSGNMMSELTSPSFPECPHDMQQLAEIEEYPILSATWIPEGEVRTPLFQLVANEYLEEYSNKSGSLTFVLRQFLNRLFFVGDNITKLIPSNQNMNSKIVFAHVGYKEHLSVYALWIMARSRNVRVLRGGNLPFFNTLTIFSVQSNLLGSIFQRILGNLCQFGISKHWADVFLSGDVKGALNFYDQREQREFSVGFIRKTNLARIWRNFSPELMVDEAAWSGLTLESLSAAFQLFLICLLLALCVFIKERRILQIIAHLLLQKAKIAPIVLNYYAVNFEGLWRTVVDRATIAVQPEPT